MKIYEEQQPDIVNKLIEIGQGYAWKPLVKSCFIKISTLQQALDITTGKIIYDANNTNAEKIEVYVSFIHVFIYYYPEL